MSCDYTTVFGLGLFFGGIVGGIVVFYLMKSDKEQRKGDK